MSKYIDISWSAAASYFSELDGNLIDSDHEEEFWSLNMSKKEDALYAIQKWIIKPFKDFPCSDEMQKTAKNSLHFFMTRDNCVLNFNIWLNGIENHHYTERDERGLVIQSSVKYDLPLEEIMRLTKQFFVWVWEELFQEPFVPIPDEEMRRYRIRTDGNFWGTVIYVGVDRRDEITYADDPMTWNKHV